MWLQNSTFFFFARTGGEHTLVFAQVRNRKRLDRVRGGSFVASMWRSLLALFLIVTSARGQEQGTAYDALLTVGNQFNRAAISRVISVTGVDGDPQPAHWNILIADENAPGGVREFRVGRGRILSNRTPNGAVAGTSEGATIDTAKLNLDSSGAFSVASYTADKSHVNFDLVTYTLRANDRGTPVWIVTLQDRGRRPLGTIHIAANRGNVTRVEGMYQGRNITQVEQDPVDRAATDEDYVDTEPADEGETDEDDGDVNVVKAEIKRMFRRTKRDAQHLFHRVRRSFDDFFNRR